MPTITEAQLRQMVANQINEWLGAVRGGTIHKKIIDSYNNFPEVKNNPKAYKMTYKDAWCACTVSVVVQILGIYPYTDYDVSCASWTSKAQKRGIWIENEATYMPKVGDFQLYCWTDSNNYTSVDLKGSPNHIGIVTSVNGTNYAVTEGNKGSKSEVGIRNMVKNSKYSRGFIAPDYASIAKLINEGKLAFPEIRPDGGYNNGYLTTAQVKEMQKYYGLSADGYWGPASQKAQGSAIDAWCRYKGIPNTSSSSSTTTQPVVTSTQSYTVGKTNEESIYNFLKEVMKFNTAVACGVLANIQAESSFNPNTTGDNGTSYGICQWHNTRFTDLKNYCASSNRDYRTLDGQLWFLKSELESKYSGMLKTFDSINNNATGAYSAGAEWCKTFEKPNNTLLRAAERGNLAKNTYWPKYSGTSTTTQTSSTKLAAKNPYPVPTQTLKKGSKGQQVMWLQWMLFYLRFGTSGKTLNQFVDGDFGPGTDRSLKAFQSTYGLAADGSCGPKTLAKLKSL